MKKKGFTLAEVLITLGVIGVIAALTLPSLMTDTASAQIGPKLAKAVSMFEQSNQALLSANSVDLITDSGLFTSAATYGNELTKHLKISSFTYPSGVARINGSVGSGCSVGDSITSATPYLSKDGVLYLLNRETAFANSINYSNPPHKQRIGNVWIDINGANKPNMAGSDIFVFAWYNDGSLRPVGGSSWNEGATACSWRDYCKNSSIPGDYRACAGAIFENNLKVLYR